MALMRGLATRRATSRAVLIVFCTALVTPHALADEPRVQPATISRIRGAVQTKAPGQTAWRAPNERERITPGTQVKTGADGEVILRLSERNIVRLGPNSDFTLSQATVRREDAGARVGPFRQQQNSYQYEMNLDRGTATSLLRGLGTSSQYNIRTPVAVAGVRGTIFTVTVRNPGAEDVRWGRGGAPNDPGNSNVGNGNQGQGVGNTGPGNQGNDGTMGNAGGDNPGQGNNNDGVTCDITVIEGSVGVTTGGDGGGGGEPIIVNEGFTLTIDNAPAPPPDGDGAGDGSSSGEGSGTGAGTGTGSGQPTETTGGAAAEGDGAVSNIEITLTQSTPNEEALTNEVISLPNIQAEIQLRVGTSSGGTGICE